MSSSSDGPVKCRPRKPLDLEAWLVTGGNLPRVAEWCGGRARPTSWPRYVDLGHTVAYTGDYVMRGITGHFFKRTAEEYEREYEVIHQ